MNFIGELKTCNCCFVVVIGSALLLSTPAVAQEETPLTVWAWGEGGLVWQSRNDVQIPADSGTRFSLTPFGKGPAVVPRVYAGLTWQGVHELRALWAPLSLALEGQFDKDVVFQGKTFLKDRSTKATYRFNSYRLTYRYAALKTEEWRVHLGFTGKIRDAEIGLEQDGERVSRTNVGFVPLLHLGVEWQLTPSLQAVLDADALAAPQGRAEDVAFLLDYSWNPGLHALAGYRTVEGGSDGGGKVYSFAWLHYAVIGIKANLN